MAQHIKILGWLDPEMPARWKEGGHCEFRLKISEVPSFSWKKTFADQANGQAANVVIEHDVVVLTCELNEIEAATDRIKHRFEQTNQTISRLDREMDERAAQQGKIEAEKRKKVLAAVSNISFQDA